MNSYENEQFHIRTLLRICMDIGNFFKNKLNSLIQYLLNNEYFCYWNCIQWFKMAMLLDLAGIYYK